MFSAGKYEPDVTHTDGCNSPLRLYERQEQSNERQKPNWGNFTEINGTFMKYQMTHQIHLVMGSPGVLASVNAGL